MVFVSPIFIFIFLPITLIGYFLMPNKWKNAWLCLFSFLFYAWGGVRIALLIFCSIGINYKLGKLVQQKENEVNDKRKRYLVAALVFNIGILVYFKYFNFIMVNIEFVLKQFNSEVNIPYMDITLPIGISFFTFQIMSYIIDVYKGDVKSQDSFINLGLYILLFPQLIAGPIVRYIDIEKQIKVRKVTLEKFNKGIERFIIGFSKKIFLANTTGYVADFVFNEVSYYDSMILTWVGIICYSLQIYYDFSGYSDMAIGLGKLFGFDFCENFNYPYISKSIKEFWRRWHISLSTWFRDYIYIPLGGSRRGKMIIYRNTLIVFLVTGLWHGASWNFIVWGLWYGIFLVLEKGAWGSLLNRMPVVFQRVYTLMIIIIGWVFFRADNLNLALKYIKGMFGFKCERDSYLYQILDIKTVLFIVLALLFALPILERRKSESWHPVLLITLFYLACLYMTGSSFNPFIYFRF